jgi:hypothetical protein
MDYRIGLASPPASATFRRNSLAFSPFNENEKPNPFPDDFADVDAAKIISEVYSTCSAPTDDSVTALILNEIVPRLKALNSVSEPSTEETFERLILFGIVKRLSYLSFSTKVRPLSLELIQDSQLIPIPSRFESLKEFPNFFDAKYVIPVDPVGVVRFGHLDWAMMAHAELHKR